MNLLIGYGNSLRGDDGFGPAVIAALAGRALPAGVRLLSCQQLAPELAADLAQAERVVFVDAAPPGAAPAGALCFAELPALARPSAGITHYFDPALLLALAGELYGHAPRAALATVTARDFDLREGLSDPVQGALPQVIEKALEFLRG